MTTQHGVAVIGDIVGSRRMQDREAGQGALLIALDRVNAAIPAESKLTPSIGDEFQGAYSSVEAALSATLLMRLELAGTIDVRFGIGEGEYDAFASGAVTLQNGSAWWNARDAIVAGKKRETGRTPTLRTWYASDTRQRDNLVNGYLLARDHLVSEMDARSRRLMLGTLERVKQVDLAKQEGITQSAVSRNLQRNGAFAIIDGAVLVAEGAL